VHLPVLALVPRRQQGLGGAKRIIPVMIGVVEEDEPDLPLELLDELLDGRTGRLAVRSLKVKKLDDGNRSVLRPEIRPVGDVDLQTLPGRHDRGRHEGCHQRGENNLSYHECLPSSRSKQGSGTET